jgi:ribonuclease HII
MQAMERVYPGYGIAQHKGYPTKKHLEALALLGITPIHRLSYGPVKSLLAQQREFE